MNAILIGLAAFLVLGSVAALEMKNLLSAVIAVGVVGLGLSVLFLLLGAPDIAITQVVVEVIVVTVMIRATTRTTDEEKGPPRSLVTVVAGVGSVLVIVGLGVAAFAVLPPFGAERPTPAVYYLAEALRGTGASNVVTSIVLDFRGYDTLGEATVILVSIAGALVIARHVGLGGRIAAAASSASEEEAPHV